MAALRTLGTTTVATLAERFDVSVRTLHRDLAALRSRGIAIDTDMGRGGGVALGERWSVPPVRFEAAELMGLVFAVSVARRATSIPFGRPAQAALGKIMAALPTERAKQIQRLCRRVVVGPPASPAVLSGLGAATAATLEVFEHCFEQQCRMAFSYRDRNCTQTRREVEPHGLLLQPPVCYLLTYDLHREAQRMFRLDRISNPRLVQRNFTPLPLTSFGPVLEALEVHPLL